MKFPKICKSDKSGKQTVLDGIQNPHFVWTVSCANEVIKMALKLVFVSLLSVALAVSLSKLEQEPQCYSRFDYEYKVVLKLVDLENKQNRQKEDNAATQEMIKASEAELSTLKEKLHTLESAEKEHDETANEMKAELEEVKSQNENLVTEIENLKEKTLETKG